MGKKRIATKSGAREVKNKGSKRSRKAAKIHIQKGILTISSSYNNTIVSISNQKGEVAAWSSAGTIGFKGTKKSTPYAATLVAKDLLEKAQDFGLQEASIVVRGIGPGRDGALRGIASSNITISSIVDATPQAHNGVRAPKPRRG